jgi:hypothetical protein
MHDKRQALLTFLHWGSDEETLRFGSVRSRRSGLTYLTVRHAVKTHRVLAVGRENGGAVEKVLAARFIELHGELIDARAELRMAVRVCRSRFVASGPLEPAVAIAHLREIQRASDVVDRAAFALERYVLSHPK